MTPRLSRALRGFPARKGFTLIEVLVSCAVLALLVSLLAMSLSSFTQVMGGSKRRMELNNQAMQGFDRLAFDLGAGINEAGVYFDFKKDQGVSNVSSPPNDSLVLLTDARTTNSQSRLARVGYQIGVEKDPLTGKSIPSLQRYVQPFYWTDNPADLSITQPDVQTLGKGIFRFEVTFLKKDGTIVETAPTNRAEIAAVICATAALDEATFQRLAPGDITSLASEFPGTNYSAWRSNSLSGYPRAVQQNIRFGQRYFYLQ